MSNITLIVDNKEYNVNDIVLYSESFLIKDVTFFIKDACLNLKEDSIVELKLDEKNLFKGFLYNVFSENKIFCRSGSRDFYEKQVSFSYRSEKISNIFKDLLSPYNISYLIDIKEVEIDRVSFKDSTPFSVICSLLQIYYKYKAIDTVVFFDSNNVLNIIEKNKYKGNILKLTDRDILRKGFRYIDTLPVCVFANDKLLINDKEYTIVKHNFIIKNGKGESRIYYE